MSNSSFGYDSVLQDAWSNLQMANHLSVAYGLRATQLTNWKRLRDFISLGVAPGLLSATFVWENALLRSLAVIFSGICSVSTWVWVIFGFAYNWDNQLELSIDIPSKLLPLISEIKEDIETFTNAQKTNNTQVIEQSVDKIKNLISQIRSLKDQIVRQQVHVDSWMNLVAQQDTMRIHHSKCGSCNQNWIQGSEVFKLDEAKVFLKELKHKKPKDKCPSCGQKL